MDFCCGTRKPEVCTYGLETIAFWSLFWHIGQFLWQGGGLSFRHLGCPNLDLVSLCCRCKITTLAGQVNLPCALPLKFWWFYFGDCCIGLAISVSLLQAVHDKIHLTEKLGAEMGRAFFPHMSTSTALSHAQSELSVCLDMESNSRWKYL